MSDMKSPNDSVVPSRASVVRKGHRGKAQSLAVGESNSNGLNKIISGAVLLNFAGGFNAISKR